jgi:5-(carboxyamino)imidazole ribonucleotide synthase
VFNLTDTILSKKIGIIGGGQLGKMMIQEAKKMGFYVIILDPVSNCPAHTLVDEHIVADFDDEKAINELANKCDVITYEFEHIGVNALKKLEQQGYKVYPTANSLEIIQNKYTQKTVLKEANIPVPDFCNITNKTDIQKAGLLFGYPMLLKACTGGYDGKGNAVVHDEADIARAYEALGNGKLPLMCERFVDFSMETSVLACRSIDGNVTVYPVGQNIHNDNILFETKVPADIKDTTSKLAMELAKKVLDVFKGVGMFCIELFITKTGDVLINEVAPRPHNSGHYSIEGCVTSQFEQHIRAVVGLPLGETSLLRPCVMINILGEEGYKGNAIVLGSEKALAIPGVKLHIYGKQLTVPKRKMGHLTVTAETLELAAERAELAKNYIKIIGTEKI